ncbi:MAG: hypothetical protein WCB49_12865 [Gammaproteobacteria bacterium]
MLITGALILVVVFLVGYLVWRSSEPPAPADIDAEQAMKAAVELHRVRRRFDVARTRTEQRSASTRVRREINDALKDK